MGWLKNLVYTTPNTPEAAEYRQYLRHVDDFIALMRDDDYNASRFKKIWIDNMTPQRLNRLRSRIGDGTDWIPKDPLWRYGVRRESLTYEQVLDLYVIKEWGNNLVKYAENHFINTCKDPEAVRKNVARWAANRKKEIAEQEALRKELNAIWYDNKMKMPKSVTDKYGDYPSSDWMRYLQDKNIYLFPVKEDGYYHGGMEWALNSEYATRNMFESRPDLEEE